MHPNRALLAIAGVACLALNAQSACAAEIWVVRSGQTTYHFNTNLLDGLGISVTVLQDEVMAPIDPFMEEPNWSFPIIESSDLTFQINGEVAVPRGILEGAIRHAGAFTLTDQLSGRGATFANVEMEFIKPDMALPARHTLNPLHLRDQHGMIVLNLIDSMMHVRYDDQKLDIFYINISISKAWAQAIGRPELAGMVIGIGELAASIDHLSGLSDHPPYVPNFGSGIVDVKLGFLDSLQQRGRLGSAVGLATATTSCNVGSVDVPWLAPMNEDHPVIHQALYRLMDGRFEQIGIAWLKHGFFALSNSQCTTCQNPSGGTFLGVGCSDTYGAGNNSDRRYLGPQSEVDPFAGTWECRDSHFSGGVADCTRRHGSSGHDAVEHRLEVEDSELGLPGALYFYEGYYIVRGDENKFNNWASVPTSMQLQSTTWIFTDAGQMLQGPALQRWGTSQEIIGVPNDGDVWLAASATDLGGGTWNYEYALLNFDSEREIRSFSIPVIGVSNIANIGYHDSDEDSGNDWLVTVDQGQIRWETDTFGDNPDAPAIYFGRMLNFRFDADAPSAEAQATLGIFKPGDQNSVTSPTIGPENSTTSVASQEAPQAFGLQLSNKPNPVNPRTTLFFDVTTRASVKLGIYDATGRLVKNLVDYTMLPGAKEIAWDGTGLTNQSVGSGVYYARLAVGNATSVRPMVVVH